MLSWEEEACPGHLPLSTPLQHSAPNRRNPTFSPILFTMRNLTRNVTVRHMQPLQLHITLLDKTSVPPRCCRVAAPVFVQAATWPSRAPYTYTTRQPKEQIPSALRFNSTQQARTGNMVCSSGSGSGSEPSATNHGRESGLPTPDGDLRARLTDVEATAAQVALFRYHAAQEFLRPDGRPYYDSAYDKVIVDRWGRHPNDSNYSRIHHVCDPVSLHRCDGQCTRLTAVARVPVHTPCTPGLRGYSHVMTDP